MTAPASSPRRSGRVTLGWVLAIPGFVILASIATQASLVDLAGCQSTGPGFARHACPHGALGALATLAQGIAYASLLFAMIGVGAVPPLYSLLFAAYRGARRFGGGRWSATRTWMVAVGSLLALIAIVGAIAGAVTSRG